MSFLNVGIVFLKLWIVRFVSSDCYVSQLPTEADLMSFLNANDTLLPEDPAHSYIFPNAAFNCSGFISSATYLALAIGRGNGRPLLGIYNDNGDGTYSVVTPPGNIPLDVDYTLSSTTNSSIALRVYYFNPPVPFVSGNVMGVHLPQERVERYRLLFYTSPGAYGLRVSRIAAPTTITVSSAVQRTVMPALYLDLCTPGDQRYPNCTIAINPTSVTDFPQATPFTTSMGSFLNATSVATPIAIASVTPVPSVVQPLPLAVIVGSIGGSVVAMLVFLVIIATAIYLATKHQSTSLDADETMMDNGQYSSVHRDASHKRSFVMSNGINGSLPPLPEAVPSPYMQPETTMSQSDPPPLPPPFQYEIPQSLDPKKHIYLSLDREDNMDSGGVSSGTPQSETAFLTPDGSPLSTKMPLASYNVLHRIGSRHGIEPMDSVARLTRLSSANSVFDDNKYNLLHEEFKSVPAHGPQATGDSNPYWKPSHNMRELCVQLSSMMYRNISRADLQFTGHLGSGEFGTVQRGVWQHGGRSQEVAIKMLNSSATPEDKVRFLREAAIMGQFAHPNIIRLHGVITEGDPVMIVLELGQAGDLRKYLKSIRPLPGELLPSTTMNMFTKFGYEVALGMEYLERREFVHRDLAARNILLTENRVCKIADFGLSRDLEDESCYVARSGAKIPIRWTAPEAINFKRYSSSSDVWSYGVVLFEIWSLGHTPFSHFSIEDTIKAVDAGKRMPPPPGCPRAVYQLMMKCWHPDPSLRPTFTNIIETMTTLSSNIHDSWTEEDKAQNGVALVLGSSLHLAENLYSDIQHIYERARTQMI